MIVIGKTIYLRRDKMTWTKNGSEVVRESQVILDVYKATLREEKVDFSEEIVQPRFAFVEI
jgi:hypothetical protein